MKYPTWLSILIAFLGPCLAVLGASSEINAKNIILALSAGVGGLIAQQSNRAAKKHVEGE